MINDFLHNTLLWNTLVVSIFVQSLKFFIYLIRSGKVDFRWLVRTGGMPSSHTATVFALSTMVGLREGFSSTIFAVTAMFSLIVTYDATGVRRAAGKQAAVINRMIEELQMQHKVGRERLVELLGHTPLEVFVGAILGIIMGILLE